MKIKCSALRTEGLQMAAVFERLQSQSIPIMDCGRHQRAMSTLARGVHITELCDSYCMNPDPVTLQEPPLLRGQCLSPTTLQLLTGSERLESVSSMELRVDTTLTSLHNFGLLLPNLTILKLSGSVVPSIRDLGSGLQGVEVLWLRGSGVVELEGVCSMGRLRELYLAYNDISDLAPLALLDLLHVLDLEGNNVDDIDQLDYLALCLHLQHLTLEGNPVCLAPHPGSAKDSYDYLQAVKQCLPALVTLDDRALSSEGSGSVSPHNVFDADWAFLHELQGHVLMMESLESETETVSMAGRPSTAALTPATAYRPGSALKASSGARPLNSAEHRPASISGARPGTAWTDSSKSHPASSNAVDEASELTCGMVVCGNPSKALLARRHKQESQSLVPTLSFPFHQCADDVEAGMQQALKLQGSLHLELRPASTAKRKEEEEENERSSKEGRGRQEEEEEEGRIEKGPIEDKDLSDLLQELKTWRKEHEQRLEKIRESKAAQVLRIDYDESEEDGGHCSISPTDMCNHPQVSAPSSSHHRAVSGISSSSCGGDESGHQPSFAAYDYQEKLVTACRKSSSSSLKDFENHADEDRESQKSPSKTFAGSVSDLESSLDDDREKRATRRKNSASSLPWRDLEKCWYEGGSSVLLKKYGQMTVQDRPAEREGEQAVSDLDHGGSQLRELRVPHRPPGHRRIIVPASPSSLLSSTKVADPLMIPSFESSPPKNRQRKVRIGPTGLPGSSPSSYTKPTIHMVVSDLLSSAMDHQTASSGGPPCCPSLRPTTTTTTAGQHRVKRSLPEVTSLPSRPAPPLFRS